MRPSEDGDHVTFCRICEAFCGTVVKVENGKAVRIAPDRANPHSQGHVCVKGVSFHEVAHDTDRVLRPLKRVGGPGEFVEVGWDEALTDIADRLGKLLARHGPEAIATYKGNPVVFSTDAHGGLKSFLNTLGVKKFYGAGSQDSNARCAANFFLYGSSLIFEVPDLPSCDFLLVLGANPLVSNGSIIFAPRMRHDLEAVQDRGEVVVIDPRRTETAKMFRHVPIAPNGDAWLLMAMLKILIEAGHTDEAFMSRHCEGWSELKAEISRIDIADASKRCNIEIETIAELADKFAAADRAVAYSRVGLCRGPFATLSNFLVSALNIAGGKFGKPGGAIFTPTIFAGAENGVQGGYADAFTRIGRFPSVAQFMASAVMPDDILVAGEGQVRALVCAGGNPVLSAPGGAELERALENLDLMFALDLYQNETNRFAHYILPVTTFLERDDIPLIGTGTMIRPFLQFTDAVLEPQGESRQEFDIYRDILARMADLGHLAKEGGASGPGTMRRPMDIYDELFRKGPAGDNFGEREGLSFDGLREQPHGVMLNLKSPYDNWESRIAYPDRKIRLWHPDIAAEFKRLREDVSPVPPLRLITRRDLKSFNSWLHNVERLVRSQYPALLVNMADAAEHGLSDGQIARLFNRHGSVIVSVEICDDVGKGTVCYPHGWGHQGGWQTANRQQGINMNLLLGSGPEIVERISGTTLMDGIAVEIEPLRDDALVAGDEGISQGAG